MINQKKSVWQIIDSIKFFHNGIFISKILVTIVFVSFGFASNVHADTPSLLLPSQTAEMLQQNANYARLSEDIYNIDREHRQTRKKGFELLDYEDNLGNGFTAGTYRNTSTGEITIVYGGTFAGENDINDIIADIALLTNGDGEPPQQREARRYAADILAEYPENDITITGHSLGGSLAQYVSMNTGLKAVTFNSGPVPFYGVNSNSDSSNILNIRTLDDPLSILLTLAVKLESGELSQEGIAANIDLLKDTISACNSPQCLAVRIGIDWDEFFNGDDAITERISSRRFTILRVLKDTFGLPYDTPLSSMFRGKNRFLSLEGGGHSMDYILTEAIKQENIYNFLNPQPQYNYTEFPEIIAQTMIYEDQIFLAGTDASEVLTPQEWSSTTNDLVNEVTTEVAVTTPSLTGPFYGLAAGSFVNSGWSGIAAASVKSTKFPSAVGDTVTLSYIIPDPFPSSGTVTGEPGWTDPGTVGGGRVGAGDSESSTSGTSGATVGSEAGGGDVRTPTDGGGGRTGVVVWASGQQDVVVDGKYSYTAWGKWAGTITGSGGVTADISSEFIFGQTTPTAYIDQRTGSASYTGTLHPSSESVVGETLATLSGTISLGVDFDTNAVSGALQIVGENGYNDSSSFTNGYIITSASGPGGADLFDNTNPPSIQADWGPGYTAGIGTGAYATILGVFYGPQAQEIGGGFSNVDAAGQQVDGVFVAKQ